MELKFILESLLFSAQKPMTLKELRDVLATAATAEGADENAKALKKTNEEDLSAALAELATEHETAARSYRLVCVAGAWQFVTQPEFSAWLRDGQPKVVLRVGSEDELHAIADQAAAAGLPVQVIRDAGRTQVAEGTPTCCAVGPAADSKIDAITGELSLL